METEIKYTENGNTLVFYKKENDDKFSFLIENNEALTEKLLNNVKSKRVKYAEIRYAVNGIFEKLNTGLGEFVREETSYNPIVDLAEKIQAIHGANIETRVVDKIGQDHCPMIYVEILLPDGGIFEGCGPNKRLAKQDAAKLALQSIKSL